MRVFQVMVAWVALTGCPRITAEAPSSGQCTSSLCGTSVAVKTGLAPGTVLTNEECARICASAWCAARPIATPGCRLESTTRVACGAIAFDCGYCVFGCGEDPSRCGDGCCDYASNCCQPAARSCRGLSCGACPAPDARCSLDACRAFKTCGGQLPAEPDPAVCGGQDSGVDLAGFCPEACTAMAAGAQLSVACADGGQSQTLDAGTIAADGGTCDCLTNRRACERACPQTSAQTCLDCAAGCAITFARCASSCR